jgi:hypothetical protein
MTEVVRTPMEINVLGDEYAGFVGVSEKTVERHGMFGDKHEVTYKYPAIMLEREHWEGLGKPTSFIFVMEV